VADGTVKDNMMRASSSFSSTTVGAENGRLGWERGGGAWCPAGLVEEESREWLEVELGRPALLTGLVTQGRWAGGQGQEFAEWVRVEWWSRPEGRWREAGGPMAANSDTYTRAEVELGEGVVTTRVRVLPVSKHPRMVCLRLELLGCWQEEGDSALSEGDSVRGEKGWDGEEGDLVEDPVRDLVRDPGPGEDQRGPPELEPPSKADTSSWLDTEYMGMAVGALVTVILILVAVIAFILYKNGRAGLEVDRAAEGKGAEGVESSEWSMVYGTARWPGRREEIYSDVSSGTCHSSPLLPGAGWSPPRQAARLVSEQGPPCGPHWAVGQGASLRWATGEGPRHYVATGEEGAGHYAATVGEGSSHYTATIGEGSSHYAATDLIHFRPPGGGARLPLGHHL
jgi:hypothetical protein